MKQQLLRLLVCPACKQQLDYHKRQSELVCTACQLAYPVRNGIPVLLKMDARRLKSDHNS